VDRRTVLAGLAALASFAAANAEEPRKELRIGYQKTGALLVVKAQRLLEVRFEPDGVAVKWVEFPFGPPLLEALSAGAVDYGYTGDAPPIFAGRTRKPALRGRDSGSRLWPGDRSSAGLADP